MAMRTPNSTERPRFGYVVPALNARHYLTPCLDALLAAAAEAETRADVAIVVVDNGSTDGSVELVASDYPSVRLERLPHVTIGTLRNHGAALLDADVIAFIDADCVVRRDHVARSLEVLADPAVHATGSGYALPAAPHWVERVWHELHHRAADGPVNYIPSGNFVCRGTSFARIGGFSETLTTGEDAELCQRMRQSDMAIHERAAVEAVHLGNPKSLRAFHGKQAWHAEGMFGTLRNDPFDKPVLLTILHVAAMAGAVVLLVLRGGEPVSWLAAPALLLLAPTVAVVFRAIQHRRMPSIGPAVLLYTVYLMARAQVLLGWVRPRRRAAGRRKESASVEHVTPGPEPSGT